MARPIRKVKKEATPQPTHPMDWTIENMFMVKKTKGDIGIEIETEFNRPPRDLVEFSFGEQKYWKCETDGSLRGGLEYILIRPVPIASLPDALDEWHRLTKDYPFKFSNRCSTHIHVNAQALTLQEFIRVCTAWWMVETALVHTQGEAREGNLFALRGKDATGIILSFARDMATLFGIQTQGLPRPSSNSDYRYAVLNHAALGKFGSLEFRFMRGMRDPKELDFWARTLYNFVHAAKGIEVSEIVRLTGGTNLEKLELLRILFGRDTTNILLDAIGPEWARMIGDQHQFGVVLETSYETAMAKAFLPKKPAGRSIYAFLQSEDDDRNADIPNAVFDDVVPGDLVPVQNNPMDVEGAREAFRREWQRNVVIHNLPPLPVVPAPRPRAVAAERAREDREGLINIVHPQVGQGQWRPFARIIPDEDNGD